MNTSYECPHCKKDITGMIKHYKKNIINEYNDIFEFMTKFNIELRKKHEYYEKLITEKINELVKRNKGEN